MNAAQTDSERFRDLIEFVEDHGGSLGGEQWDALFRLWQVAIAAEREQRSTPDAAIKLANAVCEMFDRRGDPTAGLTDKVIELLMNYKSARLCSLCHGHIKDGEPLDEQGNHEVCTANSTHARRGVD